MSAVVKVKSDKKKEEKQEKPKKEVVKKTLKDDSLSSFTSDDGKQSKFIVDHSALSAPKIAVSKYK